MEQLSEGGVWRVGFQQSYLRRMAALLRRAKIKCALTSVSVRSRAVKSAADLSLAMAAKGRSRWSRAILAKYISGLNKPRRQSVVNARSRRIRRSTSSKHRLCKTTDVCKKFTQRLLRKAPRTGGGHSSDEEAGGTMASRIQTLKLLVPGCRRLGTPVFLKEAADYIVALEMQVQALQALADCYSKPNACAVFQVQV